MFNQLKKQVQARINSLKLSEEQRSDVISKIARAKTEKELAFALLDFDNPEFFAATFPREKGEVFMKEWTDVCMAKVFSNTVNAIDSASKNLIKTASTVGKVELTAVKNHANESFKRMVQFWNKNKL